MNPTLWFKKLTVPLSNETKEVEAVQLWEVRWTSRKGDYLHDIQPEVEVFTSRELAEEFAEALKQSFALLRHRSTGTKVEIKKGASK